MPLARPISRLLLPVAIACSLVAAQAAPGPMSASPAQPASGVAHLQAINTLLETYCYDCHGNGLHRGGLALDAYPDDNARLKDRTTWEKVAHYVRNHEMPPRGKPQPPVQDRERLLDWISQEVFRCDCNHPDPGRVTLRRLNRTEYLLTIRDLLGVDGPWAQELPPDDVGYGFDNIGDVLSMPPLLLEKYLRAAEQALDLALAAERNPATPDDTRAVHRRWFLPVPPPPQQSDALRQALSGFAMLAFRRPPTAEEKDRLHQLALRSLEAGDAYEDALKLGMQAALVSPHFLFRGELQPEPNNPSRMVPIDEFALASRLSYFLWSRMPDDILLIDAAKQRLRTKLSHHVLRMLKHPHTRALTENFAGQWLQLRKLEELSPDPAAFPHFDESLRQAFRRETEHLFDAILRGDRSVMDLLDADFTFLNERLARHYGIPHVEGDAFHRVKLPPESHRRGVLTHGSILMLTSNPTRTSPVKRGKWVLDNILGAPPAPPPPDVPDLKEDASAVLSGSLRQRMEQHRSDPMCASCHARMDPIGFAFEHFDGIGAWRDQDHTFPIDASGELATGEKFQNADDLRRILTEGRRDAYLRCLAEKMLTYALGRGLEYFDRCATDEIVRRLDRSGYRFSALVQAVVESTPFQYRRGDGHSLAPSSP